MRANLKSNKSLHSAVELPPTVLTIFGATGDLALNYLLPTLLHMDSERLLPKTFRLVCVGRRDLSKTDFLNFMLASLKGKRPSKKALAHFARHLLYYRGDFEDPASFTGLNKMIADRTLAGRKHACYNRLYYFATAPQFFQPIAKILQGEGLLMGCTEHKRTVRVLVEKPFGTNLASARALNKLLLKFFDEQQIYRIDHYLGKETVQNLMVVRFANDFLEPIWNKDHIDHVEISALEPMGTGSRGKFYNQTGALKDFVQNHLLNILALIAMDKPDGLDTEAIRGQKLKVLRALRPYTAESIKGWVVRGQYSSKGSVPGYAQELGHKSQTETFAALKVFLNSRRWQGVPFYLRTGKRLNVATKLTEISVHFKQIAPGLFAGTEEQGVNVLSFQIQPDERVRMQINNKVPGFGIRLHRGNLEFGYKTAFQEEIPSAYERLLLDFMEGDQRLFIRSDEIEAAWEFIDNVVKRWTRLPLEMYPAGSKGPKGAEKLVERDGRQWWTK